jgi:hypothetical protein
MTYPAVIRPITVELWINSGWVNVTSYVLNSAGASVQRGAGGEDNSMPPTTLGLTLKNPDGRFTQDNPESPYWPWLQQNTQLRYRITHSSVVYTRAYLEVAEWPVTMESVAADCTVAVEAAGLFRRWEKGQPLISPLRRTITAANTLVAYWPMEDDGSNAQSLASGIPGRPAMSIQAAVDVAGYSGFVGSKPVPDVGAGQLNGVVATYTPVGNQNVLFLTRGAVDADDRLLLILRLAGGTMLSVAILAHTNGDLRMRFFDAEGNIISTTAYAGTHNINNKNCLVRLILANDGADVDWRIGVIDEAVVGAETVTSGTVAGQQIGRVSRVHFHGVEVPIGHAAVFNGDPTNLDVIAFDAFPAYLEETCGDRYVRVCHENGIRMRIVGDRASSPKMGPQPIGTLKTVLQECADVAHGLMFESRDELGVTFLLLDALYNQGVDVELATEIPLVASSVLSTAIRIDPDWFPHFWPGVTFRLHNDSDGSLYEATLFTVTTVVGDLDNNSEIGIVFTPAMAGLPTTAQHARIYRTGSIDLDFAGGEISRPFRMVKDDRATANEIVLTRRGGSEYTARQDTGPRSVLEPPDGIGLYQTPETLNLYSDGQLGEHAEWMLAHGVLNDVRLPALEVELHRSALASRQADLLNADIGHQIVIDNAAAAKMFDPIRLLQRGYTETFDGNKLHSITPNAVPARLLRVLTFDDPDHRWAAESTVLGEAINSTQTGAIDVAVGQEVWTTAASDFPMDIMIGGERVILSDINGTAGTITAVGVGTAATADNASVTATLPVGAASGHTVLLLASIRNTGATVNTPTNWTVVAQIGTSTKLMARVYNGVWTMPAVTFTSGVAGDSTIAQSAAFNGIGLVAAVTNTAVATTTSADMLVSTNAMDSVAGQYGLRLAFGAKFDDWTSVEPPDGLTELQESDTTTGNDIGQTWAYAIDSSSGNFPASSGRFTVTGGGSAWYQTMVVFFAAQPQEFVISARSVNGVVKSHSPGAVIDVADPSYYGL